MDALVEGELAALQRRARRLQRGAARPAARTQASRYAITLTATVRYGKVGRARSRSGPTTPSLPRRVRGRLRPRQLLRPRGAGHRPPGHVVRAQPGGRDAGGVLTRRPRAPAPGSTPSSAPTRYLAEQALESAARGRGGRRPRGLRPGLARRRDDAGAASSRPRARARCSPPGARWWCAARRRSRARATRCAAYLDDPTPGRGPDPHGGQAGQAARRSGSGSWSARTVAPAEPLKGRAACGLRGATRSAGGKLALRDDGARGADRARGPGPAAADGRARQAGGLRRRAARSRSRREDVAAVLGRGAGPAPLPAGGRLRRRAAAAAVLGLLETLLDEGEPPLKVLATLHRALRQVRAARALREARVPPRETLASRLRRACPSRCEDAAGGRARAGRRRSWRRRWPPWSGRTAG